MCVLSICDSLIDALCIEKYYVCWKFVTTRKVHCVLSNIMCVLEICDS